MPSETSRPQAETRTISVKGQRLRIAIRPGNGARPPLLLMNGIGVNLEVLQPFVLRTHGTSLAYDVRTVILPTLTNGASAPTRQWWCGVSSVLAWS